MRAASLSEGARRGWRRLAPDRRLAVAAAVGLIVSTIGPFSWVEAAEIVVATAVLAMVERRSQGRAFRLPSGDGGATIVAGGWCALLVMARAPDRPLLQTLVALLCAAAMIGSGARRRSRERWREPPTRRL